MGFRALREGVEGVRLQGSLLPDTAPLGFLVGSGGARRKARYGPFQLLHRVGQIE